MARDLQPQVAATLLRQQMPLHVLARVGARTWLLLSPMGWADTPQRRVLALGLVAYDLATGWWLWRAGGPPMWVRWLLDIVDVTVWVLLCPARAPFTAALVVTEPLLVATTVRSGVLAGAAGGLAMAAWVCGLRVSTGSQPFVMDVLLYQAMCVGLGVALVRVLAAEARRHARRSEALLKADLAAAALAGRNDVLTGVGTDVVDDLQSTIMRLTAARVDAALTLRAAVGRHKQRLAEVTRRDAVYLRDALDAYSTSTRVDEPAVARHVFFDIEPDAGVCVLTRAQADDLFRQLQLGQPRGVTGVRLVARGNHGPVELEVDGRRISVPGPRGPRVRLSPTLVVGLGLALFTLTLSDPVYGAQPLRLTAPLAALAISYAWVGHALCLRRGNRFEPWVGLGALAVFLLDAVAVAHFAATGPAGRALLLDVLPGLALVLGAVRRPPASRLAPLGLVAAAAIALGRTPDRYAVTELIWPAVAFVGARLLRRAVDRFGVELTELIGGEHLELVRAARHTAAQQEVTFLLDVMDQGRGLCRHADPGPIRDQVVAELDELWSRLNLPGYHLRLL